jgi:hypothetical protein
LRHVVVGALESMCQYCCGEVKAQVAGKEVSGFAVQAVWRTLRVGLSAKFV